MLPIEELTPRQIVAELDKHIIGQDAAKRAVAVALRNRFRRQQLPESDRDEVLPWNILMVGPTGVGKTEIARRLANLARAPFIKVEATKFTEVGYVGRDVESMIRDLVGVAVRLVEREQMAEIAAEAEQAALERIVELLRDRDGDSQEMLFVTEEADFGEDDTSEEIDLQDEEYTQYVEAVRLGIHDGEMVEVDIEEDTQPFMQVFTPQGMEEMGLDLNSLLGGRTRTVSRRLSVRDAKRVLADAFARSRIDMHGIHREAVERTEQTGIVFLDEIDKIAMGSGSASGPDVSREGVQRDLLPVIEGSTVQTKFGPVRTDHILFIAAGAFHECSPSDLIPELQGRLPIRVDMESLGQSDFRRILSEPANALPKQLAKLLAVEGVHVEFEPDALHEIARMAAEENFKTENIGARRLHTMMDRLLGPEMFRAPEDSQAVRVTPDMVRERLRSTTH